MVHIHYTVSEKNRTPITFWNNSNKLCLIIIMISWENRQNVLNIVVCYGLTIFHKTGYQLRLFPMGNERSLSTCCCVPGRHSPIAHGLRCSIKARMHRPDICGTGCKGGLGILSRCRTSTADASCDWTAGRWRVRFPAGMCDDWVSASWDTSVHPAWPLAGQQPWPQPCWLLHLGPCTAVCVPEAGERCGWTEAALGRGLVWPTSDRCRWRNPRMEKTSLGLCSSKETALWTSAVTSDYDVANQQFVQLQTLAL